MTFILVKYLHGSVGPYISRERCDHQQELEQSGKKSATTVQGQTRWTGWIAMGSRCHVTAGKQPFRETHKSVDTDTISALTHCFSSHFGLVSSSLDSLVIPSVNACKCSSSPVPNSSLLPFTFWFNSHFASVWGQAKAWERSSWDQEVESIVEGRLSRNILLMDKICQTAWAG